MKASEKKRLLKMCSIEQLLRKKGYQNIGGVDEAGRGPLAGPIVACVCILKENLLIENINDSKQLDPILRNKVYQEIINHPDISYAVGIVDEKVIDEINILQASLLAMKKAIESLSTKVDYLIFDGKFIPKVNIPAMGIVKGDALSISIAAASIIAKEKRDSIMDNYHKKWPKYLFNKHKGYATKKHKEALSLYGPCEIHRKSFDPIKQMQDKIS